MIIRDARPSDAPFLAECILAGFHFADFDNLLSDDLSDFLEQLTECEGRAIKLKPSEEKWLRNLYGTEYDAYCKRVNRTWPWFPKK